ncbi:response regulator [bacterium]|nr:response regulator [bacterium]MCI0605521.1 response regulator [bacterium]
MSLNGLRVLVVEDEFLILELFEFTLKLNQAEVRTARSVNEALSVMESWLPEIVITDIGLPEQDGYAFISTLRMQPQTQSIPVIALSGYVSLNQEGPHNDALLIKLAKPVDPDHLIRILAEKSREIRGAGSNL